MTTLIFGAVTWIFSKGLTHAFGSKLLLLLFIFVYDQNGLRNDL